MRLLIVPLLALLLGCTPRPASSLPHIPHRTLLMTYQDVSPPTYRAIKAAADEWRDQTNSIVSFDIRFVERRPARLEATELFVRMINSNDPDLHFKSSVIGWYDYSISTLFVVSDRLVFQDDIRTTALHELGHSLLLPHLAVSTAIMNEWPLLSRRHITGDDLVALCAIWGCDPFSIGHP